MERLITKELHPGPKLPEEVAVSSASIRGSRQYQEDSLLYEPVNGGVLGAVLDGMGGMKNGKEASKSAAEALAAWFEEHPVWGLPDGKYWEEVFSKLDKQVWEENSAEGAQGGGTTIAAAFLKDGKMTWASVGDSMIYLIRDGYMTELVTKHNYRMILEKDRKKGEITPEEYADELDRAEELISYLGMNGLLFADISEKELELEDGDIILICTDGLYKALSAEEIRSMAETLSGETFYLTAAYLIKAVLNKTDSEPDNISIVGFQYQKGETNHETDTVRE